MNIKKEEIDCTFLEVSINSNRLLQILQKQMKQLNEHASQIKILKQVIPKIKQSVNTSLQTTQARVKLQVQKNAMKTKQQLNLTKAYLQNLDLQISKLTVHCDRKFKEQNKKFTNLQEQIKRIQSTINMYQQNRLNQQQKIDNNMRTLQEEIQTMETQINQFTTKIQDKLFKINTQIQMLRKKRKNKPRTVGLQHKLQNNNPINLMNRTTEFTNNLFTKTNEIQQKNKKIQQICKQNNIQSFQYEDDNSSLYQQQNQNINFDNFNSLFNACNKQNLKRFQTIKNKAIVYEQKLQIGLRKIQKVLQTQSEIKLNFKKIQQRKIQEYHLELINNHVNQLKQEIQEDIDRKVHKEAFEKQKNKILQKISIIQQNLTQKAQKFDMKKALHFIQQKIKQIIILIACEQNQDKDGAIKKMSTKCLSCDKGLQIKNQILQNQMLSNLTSTQTTREAQPSLIRTINRKKHRASKTNFQKVNNI